MSEADKMLEEVFYYKQLENEKEVFYKYNEIILGDTFEFELHIYKASKMFCHCSPDGKLCNICPYLLKCIYKKYQELGWLD